MVARALCDCIADGWPNHQPISPSRPRPPGAAQPDVRALDATGMERLWKATRGNLLLARLLSEFWRSGKTRDHAMLAGLLAPWRSSGLLGPDGRPLRPGGDEEHRIITDVREISDALLRQVSENPLLLYEMPPRRFEELVAELLERAGYTVTLTPQTRDGGKDMHAARNGQPGPSSMSSNASGKRPIGLSAWELCEPCMG